MRTFRSVAVALLLVTVASGQLGLDGQPAKSPDLVRALDAVSAAFANAQREAAAGNTAGFKEAMNVANVRWADCYRKFRVWPTSDTAWRTNFDAINSALLNAVNAITPGNNLPAAKVQIDAAVSTLSGLRSRNNILDVQGAAANLNTSLQGLQSTIISLQGRPLTAADVAALKTSFGTFRDSYAVYTQAAAEANAYGLGQGELQALRKMVLLQNIGIDTFYNVLGNPGTPQLLTQWQTLRDQIATMMADLNTKAPAPDPAQPAEAPATTESTEATPSHSAGIGHDRPRLFPRLRR